MPPEDQASFGDLLRGHRRAAKLSQQELAERSRLSLEAVSALERGLRSRPRADTVRLLIRALHLDEAQAEAMMLARARPHRTQQQPSHDHYRLLGRVTPMVGRTLELRWARSKVGRLDSRLITFTGPPGVGKTRLAEAVLNDVRYDFHTATSIDVTRVAVPELLLSVIAAAIGAPEGGRPGLEGLIAYIGERPCLLLLDNFEHLLQAAPLIGELVFRCPHLQVVVTSRSSLGLRDEQELYVSPLPLAQAVVMFVERVRSRVPGFTLTAKQRGLVESLCLKLDCLPLALELAAPWLRLMLPEALLERLNSPFEILVGGAVDLPERQRTMRAALDWSYALLDRDERSLFRILSAFSGGASLEAVEAIGQACSLEMPLAVLARLTDRSLAMTLNATEAPRVSMLQTLREYGQHLLETSGERDRIQRMHSEWYARLAAEGELELTGSEQTSWLDRLEAEHDNLRSALQWARDHGDAAFGLELAACLCQFWNKQGHLREGRTWLEHFLSLEPDVPRRIRAKALRGASGLSSRLNDIEAALRYGEASLALYQEEGDRFGIEAMMHNLAVFSWHGGDLGRTLRMWEMQHALRYGERRPAPASPDGSSWERRAIVVLENLARVHRDLGGEWRTLLGFELIYLGTLGQSVGERDRARAWLDEAVELAQGLGWVAGIVGARNRLADIARDSHDIAGAIDGYCDSLRTAKRTRDVSTASYCIEGLAACSALRALDELAARLYGAVIAIRVAFGAPQLRSNRSEHDAMIAALRKRLGEERFRQVWSEGGALSFDEAVTEALTLVTA